MIASYFLYPNLCTEHQSLKSNYCLPIYLEFSTAHHDEQLAFLGMGSINISGKCINSSTPNVLPLGNVFTKVTFMITTPRPLIKGEKDKKVYLNQFELIDRGPCRGKLEGSDNNQSARHEPLWHYSVKQTLPLCILQTTDNLYMA